VNDKENDHEQPKHAGNPGSIMDGARIISYNFNEDERPGGIKVRAKIRIVSGKQAEAVAAAQAEAIRELLIWVRQQRRQTGQS
jgi:hypothetical protein